MKKFLSKAKDILFFPVVLILLVIVAVYFVIQLPLDYIRYKRSLYYKREGRKYTLMAASSIEFELYNEIAKNDLPISFIHNPEESSIIWGIFTLGDTMITTESCTACYKDGCWCVSYEENDEEITVPLDEYIAFRVKEAGESFGREICRDAVVLLNEDEFYAPKEAVTVDKRLLVYNDKNRVDVLKAFCGGKTHNGITVKNDDKPKSKSAKTAVKIVLSIVGVVAFLVLFIVLLAIGGRLLLPKDYLFCENTPVSSLLLIPLIAVATVLAVDFCISFLSKRIFKTDENWLGVANDLRSFGKWNAVIIALWLVLTYACLASFTYVTDDKIVVVKPWDPQGQEYSYSDVESIETGFGNKRFSLFDYEEEGSFYYKITVGGNEVIFHTPTTNSSIERFEDTYLELEEFDIALTQHGIPKKSSLARYDKCDFDEKYVDRFIRIIER